MVWAQPTMQEIKTGLLYTCTTTCKNKDSFDSFITYQTFSFAENYSSIKIHSNGIFAASDPNDLGRSTVYLYCI